MGWFTSQHTFGTFVHEFGHVIDFFHNASHPCHEKLDTFSGLGNTYSKGIAHNEYKKNYCQFLNATGASCPYKVAVNSAFQTSNAENKHCSNPIKYNFSQTEALTDFILSKVKNFKMPGKNFNEQEQFAKNMLLKIFIISNYGRSLTAEIHSEGFTYWLLTPENQRDKAWKIWNEFFLEYLPKLRADTPHFNDYLKNQSL